MQQFTIPQFIDVEAKIIGPITTRQFIIMLAGVVLSAISYSLFDFSLFLTAAILSFIIVGLFGFAKINGRPFHYFVLNFIQTVKKPRLRVWDNTKKMAEVDYKKDEIKEDIVMAPPAKHYTKSKLAELSLIVDTGGAYQGEDIGSQTDIKPI